jgi:nucleotide-binding universal stress UspA family protein
METAKATAPLSPVGRDASGLGRVAVGTDGSACAARAVRWAADEAARRGRPLVVVHATETDRVRHVTPEGAAFLLEEGERILRESVGAVREHHPELATETVLSRGGPAESVLEAAGEDGTPVFGSRGLGGFSALLLGSCTLKAAARTLVPLVVVRGPVRPLTGVVVAAVRDDGDRPALRFAAQAGRCRGAEVRALSAWMFLESVGSMAPMVDDISAIAAAEQGATHRTAEPVRREFPDVKVTEEVVRARSVAGTLVEASEHADLLVLGARRPAHPAISAFGGVTHALLHHARCPVAIVPRL